MRCRHTTGWRWSNYLTQVDQRIGIFRKIIMLEKMCTNYGSGWQRLSSKHVVLRWLLYLLPKCRFLRYVHAKLCDAFPCHSWNHWTCFSPVHLGRKPSTHFLKHMGFVLTWKWWSKHYGHHTPKWSNIFQHDMLQIGTKQWDLLSSTWDANRSPTPKNQAITSTEWQAQVLQSGITARLSQMLAAMLNGWPDRRQPKKHG